TANQWKADDVARVILTGIEKGRFEISPGLEIGILTRLHSVMAPILNRYFDQIVAKHPRP
ncbi:MAG: short-chain dehydrogenase, partial [Cyanobacteria bacterium J06633_2]